MFNSLEKQTLKVIQDLAPLIKDLSSKYQIGEIKLSITGSVFSFGKPAGVSIRVIEKSAENYETHWDSLIFAIMGADAKADIIDGVDIERTTTAAIEAVKKLASERDENLRVAEAFQAASNLEYASIHRYYHNGAHVGNIRYPSELIEIFRAEMVSKLKEDIEKARSIGRFQEIYVNVPSGHAGIAFDPSAELTNSIQDNARNHYRKMMESEISDFVAGLGQPGEPTTPKQFQDVLMKRVASVFTNATQTE